MTPSRSELVLQVALDIVRSGYAELPAQCRCQVVTVERSHRDRQYRLEQLAEAQAAYEYIHGTKPPVKTLALMMGLSSSSVWRLLRTGANVEK